MFFLENTLHSCETRFDFQKQPRVTRPNEMIRRIKNTTLNPALGANEMCIIKRLVALELPCNAFAKIHFHRLTVRQFVFQMTDMLSISICPWQNDPTEILNPRNGSLKSVN